MSYEYRLISLSLSLSLQNNMECKDNKILNLMPSANKKSWIRQSETPYCSHNSYFIFLSSHDTVTRYHGQIHYYAQYASTNELPVPETIRRHIFVNMDVLCKNKVHGGQDKHYIKVNELSRKEYKSEVIAGLNAGFP